MIVCFLRVFCVFCVVYFLRSATATLTVSMCFPRVWRGIGAVHTVWSPNNTKHAKYTHKTCKLCEIIDQITYLALICVGKVVLSTSVLPFCVVFNASSHILFPLRSPKPRLLADVTPIGYGGQEGNTESYYPYPPVRCPNVKR